MHVSDVADRDFSVKEELKFLCIEGFGRLQGQGRDAFVGGFGGLTPLQGTKSSVSSQGNPIKNGNVGVKVWQCFYMFDHPKSHLVGNHVVAFGNVFIVLEGASDDLNEVGFGGAWRGESPVNE